MLFLLVLLLALSSDAEVSDCMDVFEDTCFIKVGNELTSIFAEIKANDKHLSEGHIRDLCRYFDDALDCVTGDIEYDCSEDVRSEFLELSVESLRTVSTDICKDQYKKLKGIFQDIECWDIDYFLNCTERKTNVDDIIYLLRYPVGGEECLNLTQDIESCFEAAKIGSCREHKGIQTIKELVRIFREEQCKNINPKFSHVTERTTTPIATSDVTERRTTPIERSDITERTVTPVETSGVTGRTTRPTETSDVTERIDTPIETSDVTERTGSPIETSDFTERTKTPFQTSDVTERTDTPFETSEVTKRTDTPVETSDVTERTTSPVETSYVTERTGSPVEISGLTERTATPVETSGVTERAASPVETSDVAGRTATPESEEGESPSSGINSSASDITEQGGASDTADSDFSQVTRERNSATENKSSVRVFSGTGNTSALTSRTETEVAENGGSSKKAATSLTFKFCFMMMLCSLLV